MERESAFVEAGTDGAYRRLNLLFGTGTHLAPTSPDDPRPSSSPRQLDDRDGLSFPGVIQQGLMAPRRRSADLRRLHGTGGGGKRGSTGTCRESESSRHLRNAARKHFTRARPHQIGSQVQKPATNSTRQ